MAGVLKDQGTVSDVLQITFTRLIEQGGEVNADSLRSWLFRVAYNEAMLVHRKHKVDQKAKDALAWRTPKTTGPEIDGLVVLTKKERADEVRQALNSLPPEQKQIVELRIREGLKFAQIAEQLSLPLGTVLTRMRSGLNKLKHRLESESS